MIHERSGNLLAADVDALVNTVNTVGVMGKGIALQFKHAYPEMFAEYARAARAGGVQRGRMHVWETGLLDGPRFIINFPTKGHWRSPSRLVDIEDGLVDLVAVVRRLGIASLAVPPLGAGNGGLAWRDVEPLIRRAFDGEEVDVHLYAPGSTPRAAEMVHAGPRPEMSHVRAALVALLAEYSHRSLSTSLVEVQKLVYFLQAAGEPLHLRYVAHRYGPYADGLRHVLEEVEGHYLTGYGDASAKVFQAEPIEVLPDAEASAREVLAGEGATLARIERVLDLVEGFESMYGLELLSTVHWVVDHADGTADDLSALVAEVHRWSPRKQRMFSPRHVEVAHEALRSRGWAPTLATAGAPAT